MNDEHVLPKPMTDEEVVKRAELMAGLFKLLITLDSSAIGLIAVYASDFSSDDLYSKILIGLAPIAFLVSLLGSFMLVFSMTMRQAPRNVIPNDLDTEEWWFFGASFIGFVAGIVCLILPAVFQLYELFPDWVQGLIALAMIFGFVFFFVRKLKNRRKTNQSK